MVSHGGMREIIGTSLLQRSDESVQYMYIYIYTYIYMWEIKVGTIYIYIHKECSTYFTRLQPHSDSNIAKLRYRDALQETYFRDHNVWLVIIIPQSYFGSLTTSNWDSLPSFIPELVGNLEV